MIFNKFYLIFLSKNIFSKMFKINGIKQIKKTNKLEEDKKTIVLLLAKIEANIIKGTMTNINATILEQILTINNFLLVNDWITKLAVNNNGIDEIIKINNSPFLGASPSYPFKYCIK